jgi:hypothetical protein
MPKAKRRVKAPPMGDDPAQYVPETQPIPIRRSLPTWIDVQAERDIILHSQGYEQLGEAIGLLLNWFVVGPLQLLFVVLRIAWKVLYYLLSNLSSVLWNLWMLFFFSGVLYTIFKLWEVSR